jgi:hypothetical protein
VLPELEAKDAEPPETEFQIFAHTLLADSRFWAPFTNSTIGRLSHSRLVVYFSKQKAVVALWL